MLPLHWFAYCSTFRDKSATQNRRCKVIYSYQENKADELTLAVGDVVEFFEEVNRLVFKLGPPAVDCQISILMSIVWTVLGRGRMVAR